MAKGLFKVNGAIVFTKDYTHGTIFQTTYKQGSSGLITRVHRGWFTTSFDIRLKNGKFLRRVPLEYFEA